MSPLATALAVALSAALAQVPAPPQRDHNEPPDGTPADQELWRGLRGATNDTVMHLGRINQCAYRITYAKYYQGLDAIAAESGGDRDEARALRARIEEAARAAQDAVPEKVGSRECQYTLRDLGLAMPLARSDPKAAGMLEVARAAGARCVARLAPLAATFRDRADALEAALAAADALAARRGTTFVDAAARAAAGAARSGASSAKEPAAAAPPPGRP